MSGEQSLLQYLPRNDILFQNVFRYLSVRDLFNMRAVSQLMHSVVEEYFAQNQHINVRKKDGTADASVFAILTKNNTSLKTLIVHKMGRWITDDELVPVVNDCPNLAMLNLSMCTSLTNRSLCMLGMHCDNLTHLWLGGCQWVDQDNFMVLVSNNRSLRLLDLAKCLLLDDKCIDFMAKCCPEIENLNLSDIRNLTDDSLDAIAKNCRNLKQLNINSCRRMSDRGIGMIKEYSKELQSLNCEHCRDISEDTLGALRFRGVRVDIHDRLAVALRRLEHAIDYLNPMLRQLNHNV